MNLSPKDVVVAVDLGGTSMKCALVDLDGNVVHSRRRATHRDRGPQAVVDAVVATTAELAAAEGFRARAAGVAVPGIVDAERGVAVYAANLGWRDVPLRSRLESALELPVAVGHDVRAGGVAEARLGGGRGSRQLLFVAVGTGIAGAHLIDGEPLHGAHGAASELGHIVVRPEDGPLCGCGQRGCLEALASASALERRYREASGNTVSAEKIADGGDPVAARLWRETVDYLAEGLMTATAMLDPDTVVLGGGLAQAGDKLLRPLHHAMRERVSFHMLPHVVRAELGDSAGCVGAALLGLKRLKENS